MKNNRTTCRTCCQPLNKPYRYERNGAVTEGCVDSDHAGHLADPKDLAWHNRPGMDAVRQAIDARRTA